MNLTWFSPCCERGQMLVWFYQWANKGPSRKVQDDPERSQTIQQCVTIWIWIVCTLPTCSVTLAQILPSLGSGQVSGFRSTSRIMWAGKPIRWESNKAGWFQICLHVAELCTHFEHIKALGQHGGVLWWGWWILPELALAAFPCQLKGRKEKNWKTKTKHKNRARSMSDEKYSTDGNIQRWGAN